MSLPAIVNEEDLSFYIDTWSPVPRPWIIYKGGNLITYNLESFDVLPGVYPISIRIVSSITNEYALEITVDGNTAPIFVVNSDTDL